MTDLERLFRRLVDNLIAIDPQRLHRPLPIADLYQSVIPYRTNRRSLSVDSNEDYDLLLLRLCSGEGGFIQMVSEPVAATLRAELASPNPNLDILRQLAEAELRLATEPLAHALGPGPEEAYAPPEQELVEMERPVMSIRPEPEAPRPAAVFSLVTPEPAPPSLRIVADTEPEPPFVERRKDGPRCGFCGGRLPAGRQVNFCPHCGQNQSYTRCPECQSELEIGWRHCINCGHFVGDG